MSATGGRARTGEIKRTAGGWAIRYRNARGARRQRGGFGTKGEAKEVLDDELRKARLGPLYRPNATLQELVDAFLAQYQGAPSSKDRLRHHLAKATAEFGSDTLDSLTALDTRAGGRRCRRRRATGRTGRSGSAGGGGEVAVDRAQRSDGRAQPAA